MTQGITTMQGLTIGIDLGDRYSHYCVLDKDGEVLEEGRLSTTPKAFQQRFGSAVACRIALEVGTHSPWVNQLLLGRPRGPGGQRQEAAADLPGRQQA